MAPFKIDGFGIRKLVANVYRNDPDPFSGRITYGLDDGTGRINGQRWPLKEGDPPFEPFAYARVLGELEQYKSAKNLKVHHIRPVYDGHEVYHHILHTIMDTLTYERGPPPPLMLEDTSLRLDVTADELYSVTQAVERSQSHKRQSSLLMSINLLQVLECRQLNHLWPALPDYQHRATRHLLLVVDTQG
ncbi:hypothetical protein BDZ97DRAFT_799053 [Flammula alnicola]|nr:hypothetical protein BDZ97DRAFT_799053 [Flammula alnicola]